MNTPTLQDDIDAAELKRKLDRGDEFLLLDVRTLEEWDTARIPGARLIPMQEVPNRLAEIEEWRDREIVVHCHHGMRSARVKAFLAGKGFRVVRNLLGGIDAYSRDADPSIPTY